jgi:hypothetical protein
MDRHKEFHFPAYRSLRALGASLRHIERPLSRIPTLLGAALGLGWGLTRFILAVRENLQAGPFGLSATLFLAALVGSVALLILLFSAVVGFFIGLLLEAGYAWWCSRTKRQSASFRT